MAERRRVQVTGIVQGVGYRPFVRGVATQLGLHGFVRNVGGDVVIEVEGERTALDAFERDLALRAPPLARVERIVVGDLVTTGEHGFTIAPSEDGEARSFAVSADVAPCDACLRELEEPNEHRHRYALLSCAHCGPRFTIIVSTPYDRERTSMASFTMCTRCRSQYDDPDDRRFHAQPIACAECGPNVTFDGATAAVGEAGEVGQGARDDVARAAAALRGGAIVAVKGLGGYHLACDATSERAVAALRARKHRDAKPFAVLVRDVDAAARICELSAAERVALASRERPIVLARLRADAGVARAVAPNSPFAGVMLPSTPLLALLARDFGDGPLVMTSGNRSDEPIAYDDGDARARLDAIADAFLSHDRPIQTRCDDSVVRVARGVPLLLRRARGYAPEPLRSPFLARAPILAAGAHMKTTFALGFGEHVVVSHHLGDLADVTAFDAYEEAIAHYERLFDVRPHVLVHDAHPDYASTRYAIERAAREDVTLLAVQHHRAHLASCLADNGVDEDVIGVVFDGSGLGDDGAIWGGELFVGGVRGALRAGRLRYVPLPGGERAIREPWRMALVHTLDADAPLPSAIHEATTDEERRIVARMMERGIHAPMTSSMGRLFDAVSAMTGVALRSSYDGQAAIELEWAAWRSKDDGAYTIAIQDGDDGMLEIDPRPCIRAIATDVARGTDAEIVARRFHAGVIAMIVDACRELRTRTGLDAVALSGGVFSNGILAEHVPHALAAASFRVYTHRHVPPNDGGLSLGQFAVAAARSGNL